MEADSQVHQAEDGQDKNKETSQLPHPGPRPEEAQGDSGQAEGALTPWGQLL